MKRIVYIISILVFFSNSCRQEEETTVEIVCTTNILGDLVQNLIGDTLKVSQLMGPGVDPHVYKATQGDIYELSRARVVVYNGLHLEGKMEKIFKKLDAHKHIVEAAGGVSEKDLISFGDYNEVYDPHIWFDVSLWVKVTQHISGELQRIYPHLALHIAGNESDYVDELEKLDEYCDTNIRSIPEDQRILITAHDAFTYFGRTYGMEVRGLQGISTTAEYGLRDISELVNYITEHRIKAIFVETSVPKRSIEAVIEGCRQRGHHVVLGGELFSDALGEEDAPEGTYTGMVRHNVNTITKALL